MKKTLALSIMVLLSIAGHGQIKRFTFGLAGNRPIIPSEQNNSVKLNTPVAYAGMSSSAFKGSVKEHFEGAVGMNFNGNVDYAFSEKFFLTSGLGVSYLHYKRSISIGLTQQEYRVDDIFPNTSVGQPMGSIQMSNADGNLYDANPAVISTPKAGQTSVIYLQVPMMAGTSFMDDKLLIRGGATLSWLMTSSVYKPHYTPGKGIEEIKETNNESFSPLSVAASMSISYAVLRKISIDVTAQQYFTPIYKTEFRSGGSARYTVIGLGLSYVLQR